MSYYYKFYLAVPRKFISDGLMKVCKKPKYYSCWGKLQRPGMGKKLCLIKLVKKALSCKHISVKESNWYKVDSYEVSAPWQGLRMR